MSYTPSSISLDVGYQGSFLFLTHSALHGVEYLCLSRTGLTTLKTDGQFLLKEMSKLSHLDLSENELTMVGSFWFGSLRQLQNLHLKGNKIAKVEGEAFSGLSVLGELDLSHQLLDTIERSAFVGLDTLEILNLSHNKLDVVIFDWFSPLNSLSKLIITDNKIITIESELFRSLVVLEIESDSHTICCIAQTTTKCLSKSTSFKICDRILINYYNRIGAWIMAVFIILSNLVVINARFTKGSTQFHSKLIMNMALSDMLYGIYLGSICLIDASGGEAFVLTKLGLVWRKHTVCYIAAVMSMLSSEATLISLALVAFDRHQAIVNPLKAMSETHSKAKQFLFLSASWAFGVIMSLCPLITIVLTHDSMEVNNYFCTFMTFDFINFPAWIYSYMICVMFNLIIYIIITACYVKLLLSIRQSAENVAGNSKTTTHQARHKQLYTRNVLMLLMNVLVWITPAVILSLPLFGIPVTHGVITWISIYILPLHSYTNPFLFTLSASNYRPKILQKL